MGYQQATPEAKWSTVAGFQGCCKWMVTSLTLLAALYVRPLSGCHSSSKELHICLNIYLERDFNIIETIVEGQRQQERYGRRRVIVEGPELLIICRDISTVYNCYKDLYRECGTIWELDRFTRMLGVLDATYKHLCSNGTDNVRDLLLSSGCLMSSNAVRAKCHGFDWSMSWREVLRLQVSSSDRCVALESYRHCLQDHLSQKPCEQKAAKVYLPFIDVWLKEWCGMSAAQEEGGYLYRIVDEIAKLSPKDR